MYYKWIQVPKCGEVYLPKLGIRIAISVFDSTPTVHTRETCHYPYDWFRIEEEPEIDLWLFNEGPIKAMAVKTVYRSAWHWVRWVKIYP